MLIGLSRGVLVSGLLMVGLCHAAAPAFDAGVSYNLGDEAGSLIAADFNGDRYADAAAVNYSAGTVSVVLNDKKGSFGASASYAACAHPKWMESGDVDGDKDRDLIVGCLGASGDPSISVLKNKENGTFADPVNYPVAVQLTAVALLDADGAHGSDIIAAHGNWIGGNGSIGLLTNKGDGTFNAEVTKDAGLGAVNALALIDLDGDSQRDVLALGDDGCCNANRWFKFNRVIGVFGNATNFGGYSGGMNPSPACVAVGDLNGDDRPDMVIGDGNKYTISAVVSPKGTWLQADTSMSGYPCPVAIADLNADGIPDVLAGTFMMLNDGFGNLWVVDDPTATDETSAVAADIDRDTDLDVLSINKTTGALTVRSNLARTGGPGGSGGGGSAGVPSVLALAALCWARRRRSPMPC